MQLNQSILDSVKLLIDEYTDIRTQKRAESESLRRDFHVLRRQMGWPHQYSAAAAETDAILQYCRILHTYDGTNTAWQNYSGERNGNHARRASIGARNAVELLQLRPGRIRASDEIEADIRSITNSDIDSAAWSGTKSCVQPSCSWACAR